MVPKISKLPGGGWSDSLMVPVTVSSLSMPDYCFASRTAASAGASFQAEQVRRYADTHPEQHQPRRSS